MPLTDLFKSKASKGSAKSAAPSLPHFALRLAGKPALVSEAMATGVAEAVLRQSRALERDGTVQSLEASAIPHTMLEQSSLGMSSGDAAEYPFTAPSTPAFQSIHLDDRPLPHDNNVYLARVEDLPPFKREIDNVVTTSLKAMCVVLDHGLNAASLVCLPSAFSTSGLATVRAALQHRALSVTEYQATLEVFEALKAQVQLIRGKGRAKLTSTQGEHESGQLYEDLIQKAYLLGATDIHFYLGSSDFANSTSKVRLRVGGRMREWKTYPSHLLLKALSTGYSKSTAGTNSQGDYSPSRPTSTMTKHEVKDARDLPRTLSGRFNSRPTVDGGAKATVRLLETDVQNIHIPTLHELGYAPSQIALIGNALRKNVGLIVMIGSTGSGKSTTLRTMMVSLPSKEQLECYSVEDPVEYYMPINQISIQRSSDASAEEIDAMLMSAARDLLRQDPDVIMVGEIRDKEVAALVANMVKTGHRVLTTAHGNGCIDAFDRFVTELGLLPSTLANKTFMSSSIYQHLIPVLCPYCKKPAKPTLNPEQLEALTKKFQIDPGSLFVASKEGCDHCIVPELGIRGTKGMTVVAEVLSFDRPLFQFIRNCDWIGATDYWRKQRRTGFGDMDMTGKTAFEHALAKMAAGLVDINDIETDFEPLASYEIMEMSL
ncbi:MAG: hypothetical protein RLY95_25 [Pseudomonadota bacterium]